MFVFSLSLDTLSVCATRKTNWIILKLYFPKSFLFRLTGWLLCTTFASFVWTNITWSKPIQPLQHQTLVCYCNTLLLSLLLLLLLDINVHWSRWLAGTNTHNSFDVCLTFFGQLLPGNDNVSNPQYNTHTLIYAYIVRAAKISATA